MASCVLCDLPRREFGPFRPYFPKNPRGFGRLRQRIARKRFLDAAFRDDHGGIVVRMVRVSTDLADEFGLRWPIVPMLWGEPGDSLLPAVVGVNVPTNAHSWELYAGGTMITRLPWRSSAL